MIYLLRTYGIDIQNLIYLENYNLRQHKVYDMIYNEI